MIENLRSSSVTQISGDLEMGDRSSTHRSATNDGMPFSGLMQDAIANLNNLENTASSTVEGLLKGSGVDVHAAMIATQKADLAFEAALAVRGKAVSAYQTLMATQF